MTSWSGQCFLGTGLVTVRSKLVTGVTWCPSPLPSGWLALHISHVWPQAASLIFPGVNDEHDSFLCATTFWDVTPNSKGLQIAASFHMARELQMVTARGNSEPKWLTRDCWAALGCEAVRWFSMLTWTSGMRQWLRANRRGCLKSGSLRNIKGSVFSYLGRVSQRCLKEDRKKATSPHQRGTDKGWEGQETRNERFRAWAFHCTGTHAPLTCTCVGVFAGEELHALVAAIGAHNGDGTEHVPVHSLLVFLLLFRVFLLLLNFIFLFFLFLPKKTIDITLLTKHWKAFPSRRLLGYLWSTVAGKCFESKLGMLSLT